MCISFSNLVFKLSRMFRKEDLEAIAYLYRLPVDTSGGSATGLSIMKELEKNNVFSSTNLNGLRELLNTIQRCDLIDMVEEFEKNSRRLQLFVRPQEESIRLEMSYTQAKKTEEDLMECQKELKAFCNRFGGSAAARQFYNGMLKRLQDIRENCHQYITVPLREVMNGSYVTPVEQTSVSHGGRWWQPHETQYLPGAVDVGSQSGASATVSDQRGLDLQIATKGQALLDIIHSVPPTQMAPPMRGGFVATWSAVRVPQAHSMLNLSELRCADMDYDKLSPVIGTKPVPYTQRDGPCTGGVNGSGAASSKTRKSKEKWMAPSSPHEDCRPPKLSASRGHNRRTQRYTSGKLQNWYNGIRSFDSQTSSSSLNIPTLTRFKSADDLLSQERPCPSRSRIPVSKSLPKLHRHQPLSIHQHNSVNSPRESRCSYISGGSCSKCDFTSCRGAEREMISTGRVARFGRCPSLGGGLSPPTGE